MREKMRRFVIRITIMLSVLTPVVPVLMSAPVLADCGDGQVDTNIFGCVDVDVDTTTSDGWLQDEQNGIKRLLSLVVSVLLYGIGIAAVVGVVIAGIMYLTARDNEAQVAKAKTRLIEVVIGLVAWAALFTLLKWLIPGFTGNEID